MSVFINKNLKSSVLVILSFETFISVPVYGGYFLVEKTSPCCVSVFDFTRNPFKWWCLHIREQNLVTTVLALVQEPTVKSLIKVAPLIQDAPRLFEYSQLGFSKAISLTKTSNTRPIPSLLLARPSTDTVMTEMIFFFLSSLIFKCFISCCRFQS